MRRAPFYLFVLIFGPILFAIAMWTDSQAIALIDWAIPWGWLNTLTSVVWNLLLAWAVLLLLYRIIPNASLQGHSAMIGAFVAAFLLFIGKESLGLYFSHAVSLHQLYGSIGLVPIFMFWMYLMWLIILLGLQVAAIVEQVSEKTTLANGR